VPAVVATHNARGMIRDGEILIVDGDANVVIVNPDRAVLAEYRLKQTQLELERQKLKRLRLKPADTLDGCHVELHANIELPEDLEQAMEAGANGVGCSVPSSCSSTGPAPLRRRAVRGLPERRCRTRGQAIGDPDIRPGGRQDQGGAGRARARRAESGAGPAGGALLLAEPRLFLTQLRAILRASHYGNVRILIPMLASAGEIDQALAMIAQAEESLREQGIRSTRTCRSAA